MIPPLTHAFRLSVFQQGSPMRCLCERTTFAENLLVPHRAKIDTGPDVAGDESGEVVVEGEGEVGLDLLMSAG